MSVYNQAIAFYEYKHLAYEGRADLFWKMEEYDNAHQDYLKALEKNPDSAYAWKYKGLLNHYRLDNSKQAIKDLTVAVGLDSDPDTWYELASVLWHIKDPDALSAYELFLNFCQYEICEKNQVDWASRFIACVNRDTSCTWRKEFYQEWLK